MQSKKTVCTCTFLYRNRSYIHSNNKHDIHSMHAMMLCVIVRTHMIYRNNHPRGLHARSTKITAGDSQDTFHTTGAVVINYHKIAGVFMIQSDDSVNEDNMEQEHIPEDWGMGANKKGSMTLKLFVKFCEWLVEYRVGKAAG